ncbi:hypothetical protein BFW01_g5500 [Lasiodiplodia theobromae]|uniref:uncharacterized protein n=1 Tax=Lasiodiplodia theobromae TaxID=45133 RepID=UPI0015C40D73|nr:uncharacterized protein LTHEOB_852 [Lasiodiplodia theobromae]KAF4540910.1 hypothetical protein LTHEOB_852 [Lasiodiplodia theobromae]KAF9634605.1 hypothetical protein BFW01_g5500 [Lasiodiplodia theobromae]
MLAMASTRQALRRRAPCRRAIGMLVKPTKTSISSVLQVSDEVREALHGSKKRPVVALETTIYTHGFPYPDNVALASHLESIVRTMGGVPATIGILDGVARVGLDPEELIRIAASAGKEGTMKISRRDLAYSCGLRLLGPDQGRFTGGTTVAGTMILAQLAGIKVFGTGGLGGVHRGGENTMDISADLTELGRTPVAVVSSGCKSFLDIPRTLEYLETQGVAVATFADGRTGSVDFPAFWSRESGVKSPSVVQNEKEAAAMIYAQHALGLSSGISFANPVPTSAAIPKEEIDGIIDQAVAEAEVLGISGARNTPFILNKIKELTKGKSIPANRALIASNVERATNIAKELLALEEEMKGESSAKNYNIPASYTQPSSSAQSAAEPQQAAAAPADQEKADVVVTGAVAVDFACNYIPPPNATPGSVISPQLHTSNQASIQQTLGGVAHNIARAAHLAGSSVRLCSAVGDDVMGRVARDLLERSGLPTASIITRPDARTGQYIAVNDAHNNLTLGMADMDIIQSTTATPSTVQSLFNAPLASLRPHWLVADANWSPETLHAWLRAAKSAGALTAFEPVSAVKSARLFTIKDAHHPFPLFPTPLVDLTTPNAIELETMWRTAREAELLATRAHWAVTNAFNLPQGGATPLLTHATSPDLVRRGVPQQALQLLPLVPTILTTLGPDGVLLAMLLRRGDERLSSPDAAPWILSRGVDVDVDDEAVDVGGVYMRLFKPEEVLGDGEVVSVNGVGDTFTGVLVSGLSRGMRIEDVVPVAQRAAGLSLRSEKAVSEDVAKVKALLT